MSTRVQSASAWGEIVRKAFKYNQRIKDGYPIVITTLGVPSAAARVGVLAWDETNGDAYICTVAAGTWVKINA